MRLVPVGYSSISWWKKNLSTGFFGPRPASMTAPVDVSDIAPPLAQSPPQALGSNLTATGRSSR